jgi:hypothetical protein
MAEIAERAVDNRYKMAIQKEEQHAEKCLVFQSAK